MTEDPNLLTREAIARYQLKLVPAAGPRHPPQPVADFLHAEVITVHPPGEYLGAVFVNDLGQPLATSVPYLGYLGRLHIEAKSFLAPAVMIGADALLLFHHRPGAEPKPTRRDVRVAKQVRKAATPTGLQLLDYLLFGDGGWTSMHESGRMRFSPRGERPRPDGRARVKPKYRDPNDPSRTWSGRGNMARWLEEKLAGGGRLEDFAVED